MLRNSCIGCCYDNITHCNFTGVEMNKYTDEVPWWCPINHCREQPVDVLKEEIINE
jgi:hypothetical protein